MKQDKIETTYAKSTWKKIKIFQEGLKDIEKLIPMSYVRDYLLTGKKINEITENTYKKIDELQEIRMSGISSEMKYAIAQAKKSNLTLKEDIITGKDMAPGFSKSILSRVPSLEIYTHFMWYTKKELKDYRNFIRNTTE